jgi:hypothetical protein
MEEEKVCINIEKLWNWNMSDECATSCSNFLIAYMHVINAVTLLLFIFVCYLMACLVNFINYKNFKVTTESLLFSSAIIYSLWNLFFGHPIRKIDGSQSDIVFSYKTHAISHFVAIIFAVVFLFVDDQF